MGVRETVKIPSAGGEIARRFVPYTSVLVSVLEAIQVSVFCCEIGGTYRHRAPSLVGVLETFQVSIVRRRFARLGLQSRVASCVEE